MALPVLLTHMADAAVPSALLMETVLTITWAELDNTFVLGLRDSIQHQYPDITLITFMAAAYAWHGRDDESLFVQQMR